MSHFLVAVISDGTKTIDQLLAPFDENISVTPYIDVTKEEIISFAKEYQKKLKKQITENNKKKENWMEEYLNATTDEEFYNAICSNNENEYDDTGNHLSTRNPNAKWDWYEEGGRWEGFIKTANGNVSSALIKDIILEPTEKELAFRRRWWEVCIEGAPLAPSENKANFFNIYKKEYIIKKYKDKENYARIESLFSTFAVVTPDGEWHEKGEMGWFGCSSDTPEESNAWDEHFKENFIDTSDPNWTLTIVDCHI